LILLPSSQRWLLGLLLAELVLVQLYPPFPALAPLQHGPTLAALLAAPWLLRRWPLSTRSLASLVGFLALHTLAGRYIYSYVPYDAWTTALTGHPLSAAFGWRRNHFDRLVHFSFGLLVSGPIAEVLRRHLRLSPRLAAYVSVEFVLAFSCLYEVFEWLLTVVLAGPDADAYNGQQGDMWDAQKDMALAGLGAGMATALRIGRTGWRAK
jgi:putative membrane protein